MTDPLLLSRVDKLFFYSPYNFLREINPEQLTSLEINKLHAWETEPDNFILRYEISGFKIKFYLKSLPWDSAFFKLRTVKIGYAIFNCPAMILSKACQSLVQEINALNFQYCFAEIPTEDTTLLQALTGAGVRLIETRLTYFNDNLAAHNQPRSLVRQATPADIPNLRRVASEMRNDFDRFHADPVFEPALADEFLARYVEEAVKGFSDIVLVPNTANLPADSFLTANYLRSEWEKLGLPVSKMVLSAVSAATNKGWYKKLVSEMVYHLADQGARAAFMNTQSTNRAVFNTWEKLGFKLGATSHILAVNF